MKNIARITAFFGIFIGVFAPFEGLAQNENLDIVQEPICFTLINTASYGVNGDFSTDLYTRPDGVQARHRSNFRLGEAGARDPEKGHLIDRAEFCSYGPFLPNRQLHFRIRTLFPVFSCKTRVDTGEPIVIYGQRRADDNGVITWAECFDENGVKSGKPSE